jgi:hypothetical protein
MNRELAEHISLMAAPMMAAMLVPYLQRGNVRESELIILRETAIIQARALWRATLESEP